MKLIAQGAEAKILLDDERKTVIKERIRKSYRIPELDEKIRKSRTRKEAKLLQKSTEIINTPKLIKQDKFSIQIEFIDGEKLSEFLNTYTEKKQVEIMKQISTQLSSLHENSIIHGDLTTSNIILKDDRTYIIDFGLGFISQRIEDKAVDIHLIKQALEAKHFQNHKRLFSAFLDAYKHKEVIERLKKVEARGRYKH